MRSRDRPTSWTRGSSPRACTTWAHGPCVRAFRRRSTRSRPSAEKYDAIALGYGLCGNGLAGVEARSIPLVLPRAHDCITLLMGSRTRFESYFQDHPGVYYRSAGWVERGADLEPLARNQTGMGFTLDALIERYGEDNGRFLYEELTRYQQTYQQLTFIETGIEPDDRFENGGPRARRSRRVGGSRRSAGILGCSEDCWPATGTTRITW